MDENKIFGSIILLNYGSTKVIYSGRAEQTVQSQDEDCRQRR